MATRADDAGFARAGQSGSATRCPVRPAGVDHSLAVSTYYHKLAEAKIDVRQTIFGVRARLMQWYSTIILIQQNRHFRNENFSPGEIHALIISLLPALARLT